MRKFHGRPLRGLLPSLILILALANIAFWGRQIGAPIPAYTLYSSGTTFSLDGEAVNFSERMMLNHEKISYAIKVNWAGKIHTAQHTGKVSQGFRGELNIFLQDSSSFGASLIDEAQLDEDILFNRSYLENGHAELKFLPVPVDIDGRCFYLIYMQRVQCGANHLRNKS